MSRPIQLLMKHRQTVIDTYFDNDRRPQKTWEDLSRLLPDLNENMSYNTFKQYVSVLAAISSELDTVGQERRELANRLDKTNRQKSKLENQMKALEEEHKKISGQPGPKRMIRQKPKQAPKRVMGWSLQQSKDGYYRCFRKIEGRLHCIYIGKTMVVKTTWNWAAPNRPTSGFCMKISSCWYTIPERCKAVLKGGSCPPMG